MFTVLVVYALVGISFIAYGIYKSFDPVYLFVRQYVFREKIIEIEGISSASEGEYWKSVVRVRPSGKVIAFRYPSSEIGIVVLNEDGTGKYCGDVIWKYIN